MVKKKGYAEKKPLRSASLKKERSAKGGSGR